MKNVGQMPRRVKVEMDERYETVPGHHFVSSESGRWRAMTHYEGNVELMATSARASSRLLMLRKEGKGVNGRRASSGHDA